MPVRKKKRGGAGQALAPGRKKLYPWFGRLAASQQRPRLLEGGGAREAPEGLVLNAQQSQPRAPWRTRGVFFCALSASARLVAAPISPGRLGRSDVKFHLSRILKNAVVV